mmetsp:Transcript_25336/g.81707  ORF Transcript_25336/g.81707 Transcript_25336/m.81707 type:complete len:316 (-) Transcript_25336:28-975(-)
MAADLVLAPRDNAQNDHRRLVAAAAFSPAAAAAGDPPPALLDDGRRLLPLAFPDDCAEAPAAIKRERGVDRQRQRRERGSAPYAAHARQIPLLHPSRRDMPLQPPHVGAGAAAAHETRHRRIEPVSRLRKRRQRGGCAAAACAEVLGEQPGQRVGHAPCVRVGEHIDAGGLVDYDKMLVLEHDLERRLCRDRLLVVVEAADKHRVGADFVACGDAREPARLQLMDPPLVRWQRNPPVDASVRAPRILKGAEQEQPAPDGHVHFSLRQLPAREELAADRQRHTHPPRRDDADSSRRHRLHRRWIGVCYERRHRVPS